MPTSGCHTLHYNINTQSIIRLGYNNFINIFEIDRLSGQIVNVGELEGHRSIVTAVTSIWETSVCVTGDDQGYIRMWDLAYMRCFQVIRLSREINILHSMGPWLIFGDKRINMVPVDMPREMKPTFEHYNKSFFDDSLQNLYIFNHNSCMTVSMNTGELLEVFVLCEEEEEIMCVTKLKNSFCLGTNKGFITHYNMLLRRNRKYKVSD